MSNQVFNYAFNVTGNACSAIPQITVGVIGMADELKKATGVWDSFKDKMIAFNQIADFAERFKNVVSDALVPGAALNTALADLSAISGVTGKGLDEIQDKARDMALIFGGKASQSVESYKLLLSQLSPELAKHPVALGAMGTHLTTLSKTMGGSTTAAAEVLTTAMNQFGVSMTDPTAAAAKMAEMMNVMAAAGKEGSAELPQIKAALEQSGMAAKAANISFAETNAAIQVLDKAGKKGSEGGVALHNTMAILSQGRFLPKDTQKELAAAGVDINILTDKSLTLSQRLEPLKAIMKDTALFSKLFGMENSNAALALVQGTSEIDRYTTAIQGTNTAYDQAAIIMDTYAEKKLRVQARFDDLKISVFNATGDMGIWVETIAGALVPISQLVPLLSLMGKGMMASRDFLGNIGRTTFALVRFATVGVFQALKGVGALILSLVTGGATSATFATISTASFTAFKLSAVVACRAVGIAIMSIPIIGWIAMAIAAIIALGVYFWNTSATFRAVLKGIGAAFIATFTGIWDLVKTVFSSIGDLIVAAFSLDGKGISNAINKMTGGFSKFGLDVGKAFNEAYDAEMLASKKEQDAKEKKEGNETEVGDDGNGKDGKDGDDGENNPIVTNLSGIGGKTGTSDKVKNITIHIERLVDKFEIHTTNLTEAASSAKDVISEALLDAVNDINLAE